MLPSTILYTKEKVDPLGLQIYQVDFLFGQLALMCWTFTFYLPSYKTSYRAIFAVFFISAGNAASGILNCLTITHTISNNQLREVYTPLGIFFVFVSATLFSLSIGKRVLDVIQIIEEESPLTSQKSLLFFLFLGCLTFTVMYPSRLFPSLEIPIMAWCVPLSLTWLYFTYAFSKDKAFFFITPIQLDGVLIMHQNSGLCIFSYSSLETVIPEHMLTGLFSALNISLKETIQSKKVLERISFGDKNVILAPGEQVTTVLLVSGENLIIGAVAKHLSKEFEHIYQTELKQLQDGYGLKLDNFIGFSIEISKIQPYFPL